MTRRATAPFSAALLALLVLGGCAANDPRSAATAGVVPDAIQRELDSTMTAFDAAIARYARGEIDPALADMDRARGRLDGLAASCASLADCDLARIAAATSALLQRQTDALLKPATGDAIAPDADGTPIEARAAADASAVVTAMPAAARTVALLKGQNLRDAIEMNGPVKAALEEWLTWMRPFLLDAYENYSYMRYEMIPAYDSAGLPEALLFGIMAKESGGRVHSVSSAGASGPLQFMPATGQRFGLGRGADGFDTRFDPAASARANAAYLNEQFARLNNDLSLVLAAYNGGEGRMARLSGNGQRDFWEPAVFNALPPETRNYVPMVLAAAWLFLHAEDYGLSFPAIDARPATVELRQVISLNELAVCMGQEGNPRGWFRTLRNLNPRFEPERRLPAGTRVKMPEAARNAYQMHCVDSTRRETARRLADALPPAPVAAVAARGGASAPARGGSRTHVVRRGETLHRIAANFDCAGIAPLARANGLRAPRYGIRAGQRLTIPQPCR